jgi:Striatin family
MRFLQTEWHRHERDRNAWDIERAEMKSRIGRLEGESKTNKRLHDSLGKHIKILESALKKEREKVKSLTKGEQVDFGKDAKELAQEELKSIGKGLLSFFFLEPHVMPDINQIPCSRESVSSTPSSTPKTIYNRAFDRKQSETSRKVILENVLPRSLIMSCQRLIFLQN